VSGGITLNGKSINITGAVEDGIQLFNGGVVNGINIGANVRTSYNNTYAFGSSTYAWANVYSYGYPAPSDTRYKTISGTMIGLNLINKIGTIVFKWNNLNYDGVKTGIRNHFGISAQGLKTAFTELGLDAHDYGVWCLTDKTNEESKQLICYNELIPPLIKSVQELNTQTTSLQNTVNSQAVIITALQNAIYQLQQEIDELRN
jgi:hypothetical protein